MIKCNNACPLEKFEGCCHSCEEFDVCSEACDEAPLSCGESEFEDEETALEAFKEQHLQVFQTIADICSQKKQLEAQEKDLKNKLLSAMEEHNIKKFSNDILDIVYVTAGTSERLDSKTLKAKYPDIAAECTKTTKTSPYIKITVKGD